MSATSFEMSGLMLVVERYKTASRWSSSADC